jgi:outer membrane protein assembly factor BamB
LNTPVVAIDLQRTGALPGPGLWTEPRVSRLIDAVREEPPHVPVVADGVAYVADPAGVLSAVDVATADLRWQIQIGSGSRPALTADLVIAAGSQLCAVGRDDGRPRWQKRLNVDNPTVVGDLVLMQNWPNDVVCAYAASTADLASITTAPSTNVPNPPERSARPTPRVGFVRVNGA